MKSAKEIAEEAYQVIGNLARVTHIGIDNRDVVRALDYFSSIANGEDVDDILPWDLHLDSE